MAWGKGWDDELKQADTQTIIYPATPEFPAIKYDFMQTVDLPNSEEVKQHQFKNQIPTHDPYSNPGAFLYYQCECGEVLDPKTKRFAELNNCASHAGWKIRFGSQYYIPYCPKCVKEKGIE